jgi:methylenetetrahydrofolate reductase (NADPH)
MEQRTLQNALSQRKKFIYTLELVPGRGSRGKNIDEVLKIAEQAARSHRIHALSITDNPGGHPALAPDMLGLEILRMGIEPLIHFTCKDKNRNQLESNLYALDRQGISNLLVMTGDFPLYGFMGKAKPVFDLDSVQVIRFINFLNKGLDIDGKVPGGDIRVPLTHFFKGCNISPFKTFESEVMAQYYKFHNKVKAGADFIITQLGYDARKFDEVIRYMRQQGIEMPIIGNVYILNRAVAEVMNRGGVPGCVVTDDLYKICAEEAKENDKGKAARITRAAKLIAVLRGIGYNGVHIGGPNLRYEDIERVIEKSEALFPHWKAWVPELAFAPKDSFYYFEKDRETGLNTDMPVTRVKHLRKPASYAIMRLFHQAVFAHNAPFYRAAQWFFKKIDGKPLEEPLTELEYWIKFITSRCRRCGDCTLLEVAFLCPQSQCAKYLFNGQCGGSVNGWCEVFPGKKKCIYVRAYNRLKPYGEEESQKRDCIPPRDWALDQTSSWANYFLGRDHHSIG